MNCWYNIISFYSYRAANIVSYGGWWGVHLTEIIFPYLSLNRNTEHCYYLFLIYRRLVSRRIEVSGGGGRGKKYQSEWAVSAILGQRQQFIVHSIPHHSKHKMLIHEMMVITILPRPYQPSIYTCISGGTYLRNTPPIDVEMHPNLSWLSFIFCYTLYIKTT